MGLVFPLALLTSLKLAMDTTPYLPGASAAALPPPADLKGIISGVEAASAASVPGLSSQAEQRGWISAL